MGEPMGKTVQVSWVQLENGHPLRYRACEERITTSGDVDGNLIHSTPLPVKGQTRLDLARLVAGEGWTVVPSESATNAAAMLEDLARILGALGLPPHVARPYSPHECVTRDVLPAIERLRADRDEAYEQGYGAGVNWGLSAAAQPDRPEPVDPASVKSVKVVEIVQDSWPDAISDGLTLACARCDSVPRIDYRVGDKAWSRVIDESDRLGVVCLECYLALGGSPSDVEELQVTRPGETLVLQPVTTYRYPAEPEPDEAAVEALTSTVHIALGAVGPPGVYDDWRKWSGRIASLLAREGYVVSTDG